MTPLLLFPVAAIACLLISLFPLMRRRDRHLERRDYDLAVYRDQLVQLDQEAASGLIAETQKDAARVEIQRRILAASADADEAAPTRTFRRTRRIAAVGGVTFGLTLLSLVLYLHLGAPGLPGQPFASRQADPDMALAQQAEHLEAMLKDRPDFDGLVKLAQIDFMLRKFEHATEAYRHALALKPGDAHTLAELSESIVMASDGMVVPEARQGFLKTLASDPYDPRALFYLGLAEVQIGRPRDAVAVWRLLEQHSPEGAFWLTMLRNNISEQAQAGGFDPAEVAPKAPAGSSDGAPPPAAVPPPAADLAMQAPDEQDRAIHAMVERLAQKMRDNPTDLDGWMRLATSYRVLRDYDKAIGAANHAIVLSPATVEPRLALAQIQLARASGDRLPADFVDNVRKILAIDGNNPMGLFYVGRAEQEAGRTAQARLNWEKLLGLLPPDSPQVAEVKKSLAALPR